MNMAELDLLPCRVRGNRRIAEGAHLLALDRPFDFVPGQVVGLAAAEGDTPRLYSIASGTAQPEIEILFDVAPEGRLTPALARLAPGDTVRCSRPFGAFRSAPGPGFWICTGTGLAPFLSMYRSGASEGKTLIHGSRSPEGFFFQDELAAAMGERYVRCCSRVAAPGLYHGRLTSYLESRPALPSQAEYMLCGHSEMIAAVREILLARGVPFDRVLSEVYF